MSSCLRCGAATTYDSGFRQECPTSGCANYRAAARLTLEGLKFRLEQVGAILEAEDVQQLLKGNGVWCLARNFPDPNTEFLVYVDPVTGMIHGVHYAGVIHTDPGAVKSDFSEPYRRIPYASDEEELWVSEDVYQRSKAESR